MGNFSIIIKESVAIAINAHHANAQIWLRNSHGRLIFATESDIDAVEVKRLLVECSDGLHLKGVAREVVSGLGRGNGEGVGSRVATGCRGDGRRPGELDAWLSAIQACRHGGIATRIGHYRARGVGYRLRHVVVGGEVGKVEGICILLELQNLVGCCGNLHPKAGLCCPCREGERALDGPVLKVIGFRAVSGTAGEVGCGRILRHTVELGNVALVSGIMREAIKDDRIYGLTARNTRDGILYPIAELQEISASILA